MLFEALKTIEPTSVEAERAFSAMDWFHTKLRNNMGDKTWNKTQKINEKLCEDLKFASSLLRICLKFVVKKKKSVKKKLDKILCATHYYTFVCVLLLVFFIFTLLSNEFHQIGPLNKVFSRRMP